MKIVLLFCCFVFNLGYSDIGQVRKLFIASAHSKPCSKELNEKLSQVNENSEPVFIGYKGVAEVMLCNYDYNPFCKYTHFLKGKKLLETAIKREPDNIELRFLRFSVQTNAPEILGYYHDRKDDKSRILAYLYSSENKNEGLYKMVMDYMLHTSYCNNIEKTRLKNYL